MPPYPNLISDSLLINETIQLLQSFGGRASAVKVVDFVMNISAPEPNLARLLVSDLAETDPRLQYFGTCSERIWKSDFGGNKFCRFRFRDDGREIAAVPDYGNRRVSGEKRQNNRRIPDAGQSRNCDSAFYFAIDRNYRFDGEKRAEIPRSRLRFFRFYRRLGFSGAQRAVRYALFKSRNRSDSRRLSREKSVAMHSSIVAQTASECGKPSAQHACQSLFGRARQSSPRRRWRPRHRAYFC